MEHQRPTLVDLVHVGKLITIQLQSGAHGITIADVYRGLERGDLWTFLEERLPGFDSFGLLTQTPSPRPQLVISSLSNAAEEVGMHGNEQRDAGIDDGSGLALLLVLLLHAIEQRLWMEPLPSTHDGPGFPPSN